MTMYVVRFENKWDNGFIYKATDMNLFMDRVEAEEWSKRMNELGKGNGEYKFYAVEVDGLDR